MDYYSTIKRNEELIHATTSINFEKIILSEKKLATKGHLVYDLIYMKCPEYSNP